MSMSVQKYKTVQLSPEHHKKLIAIVDKIGVQRTMKELGTGQQLLGEMRLKGWMVPKTKIRVETRIDEVSAAQAAA